MRRQRENETALDQWVQFSDQFMFGWDEVAPHVWEAPRARMAEMEATGNLPKETTTEVNGPRHRHSFFARWKTFKLCGRSAKVAKRDCLLNFTVLYHFSPFERFWSIGPSGILKMAHDSPKGQN